MKTYLKIFATLFLTSPFICAYAAAMTVSGTVLDEKEDPVIGASVIIVDANGKRIGEIDEGTGTATGLDGEFRLNNVPADAKIKVSFVGYKEIIMPATKNMDIALEEDTQVLDDVFIIDNLKEGDTCPSKSDEENEQSQYTNIESGTYKKINGKLVCIPETCKDGYEVKDNACVLKTETPQPAKEEPKTEPIQPAKNEPATKPCTAKELRKENATNGTQQDGKCVATACADGYTLLNGSCIVEDAEQKYQDAKAKEQSLANRALTAATTAATGIGGMELAMGLSQQKADKEADADMTAYIETFNCSYGNGKSVKAGPESIELPGGNDQTMMNYRAEYLALADDLKIRKAALGMAPGIESEIIMDKAAMGLYDDENVGITSGNYESLYRAKMLDSEEDQAKIDANAQSAKNRVIAGAVVGGVGVVGGVLGNSLINGKLGEKIKDLKNRNSSTKENDELIEQLKSGLSSAGMKNVNKLDLSKLDITGLKDMIANTDFESLKTKLNGVDASQLNTTNAKSFASSLENLFKQ